MHIQVHILVTPLSWKIYSHLLEYSWIHIHKLTCTFYTLWCILLILDRNLIIMHYHTSCSLHNWNMTTFWSKSDHSCAYKHSQCVRSRPSECISFRLTVSDWRKTRGGLRKWLSTEMYRRWQVFTIKSKNTRTPKATKRQRSEIICRFV